jgi:hypothetical protein
MAQHSVNHILVYISLAVELTFGPVCICAYQHNQNTVHVKAT